MTDMLFTWLLVCWGAVLCQGIETSRIHIFNERDNWWKAQSRCKDKGGKLYTPGTDDIPAELVENLQSKTYYWIGAMRYWAWIWTVDDSPLFTYAGFLPVGSVTVEPKGTYLDNSVWKCHLHCSPAYSVGMKGTTCYCLKEGYNTTKSMLSENSCPGNFEERCGNIKGMSVYKLENMTFNQEEDTYCAYVDDTDLSIHTRTYYDCKKVKGCYACFTLFGANTSISCRHQKSWYAAWMTCDLVKLNTSARTSLLGSSSTTTTYWIGLYKYLHRRWINGETALKYNGRRGALSSDTRCLIVYKQRNGGKRLYWRPCSEKREFLCEDATAGRKDARKPSINPAAGCFIGLGVGCVLLVLTVLIVVCLLRRHKKLCFEKSDGNQPIHFTSAAENITYGLASHAHTESEAYAVISLPDTTDATSATSTVPPAIVRPSVHSDNININNAQVNDENEYNVLSTSNNSKVPVSHTGILTIIYQDLTEITSTRETTTQQTLFHRQKN
ncbi:uncharacterized protein LOC124285974 [Haliotis rubra]|uniref:uncharacterized protein LOC124285974 n=1 Tax=Haliotis rubra TaxID=36100 RepID=UPI001EE62EF6|nr:uncharacterized protein LOC124285974 [Haliotis rubra]